MSNIDKPTPTRQESPGQVLKKWASWHLRRIFVPNYGKDVHGLLRIAVDYTKALAVLNFRYRHDYIF